MTRRTPFQSNSLTGLFQSIIHSAVELRANDQIDASVAGELLVVSLSHRSDPSFGRWRKGSFIHRRIRSSGPLQRSSAFSFKVGRLLSRWRVFFRERLCILLEGGIPCSLLWMVILSLSATVGVCVSSIVGKTSSYPRNDRLNRSQYGRGSGTIRFRKYTPSPSPNPLSESPPPSPEETNMLPYSLFRKPSCVCCNHSSP